MRITNWLIVCAAVKVTLVILMAVALKADWPDFVVMFLFAFSLAATSVFSEENAPTPNAGEK